jgi:glutamate synthase domain-containing protein 3
MGRSEVHIKAKNIYYQELNRMIREAIAAGEKEIDLIGVNGQRYIADGIKQKVRIVIDGVPGNDLSAFMDGPTVIVKTNAQDGVGNTMNNGKVVIHGDAGDVLGYGMRGGKLFIKGSVGYRIGIHMKSYKNQIPVIIVGGRAADFFGEYMAGGILVLLGLTCKNNQPIVGNYLGTGMHGGQIFIRGNVEKYQLGAEVGIQELGPQDYKLLEPLLQEYCEDFNLDYNEIMKQPFIKLVPVSHRPYGSLYAY